MFLHYLIWTHVKFKFCSYIEIKEVQNKKPALCYKQCINLNPRMNIYMQLTLQIEMLTKTLFPVVCDSRNMRRYVYLFLNRKARKNQGIQLEPNHKLFWMKMNKIDFIVWHLYLKNFEGVWYNLRNLWYYCIISGETKKN